MNKYTLNNEDGLLQHYWCSRRGNSAIIQWVVPVSIQLLLLKLAHDDNSAAHADVESTQTRLLNRYFLIGVQNDIRNYMTNCIICQRLKAASSSKVPSIAVPPRRLYQRMTMDLLGCHAVTERGYRYVLAFIESIYLGTVSCLQ
jgi:Integrase zinc binding domain